MTIFTTLRRLSRTSSGSVFPVLTSMLVFLGSAGCSGPQGGDTSIDGGAQGGEGVQAFVGATILDGTGADPIQDGVLLVRAGIVEGVGASANVPIPEGATVVDLGGRWLIPGFINAHGHVTGARAAAIGQLQQYAHYGVTTVVSLGGEDPDAFSLRDEQSAAGLDRARIYVAGPVIAPASVEEAHSDVAMLAEMNADWVKTRVDDGLDTRAKTSPEVYGAIIDAAEEAGLPVAIHIVDLEDATGIVQAGADLVAHSVRDEPVDQTLITAMLDADVCVVPTLTREVSTFIYAERPDFFDDPFFLERAAPADLETFITPELQAQSTSSAAQFFENALPLAQENMRRLHEAGIGIAMGTDTGPLGRFQGYFEHLEMELMAEGGLTHAEVIHASTGGAASCMGLAGTVGTLEPGAFADLVVVENSPLADIRNTREIYGVWMAGDRIR